MTPESAYKKRVGAHIRRLAKLCNMRLWTTALGVGAKAGIPDQWLQIGGVIFFMEHKRKSKKARALQQERISMLIDMNQIAFCLAANPDSMGSKGAEREALLAELLSWLDKDQVEKRAVRYVLDCAKLRKTLKAELAKIRG